MTYGDIIREAWYITWRYRFLWLIGVVAGGAVRAPGFGGGGGSGWRVQNGIDVGVSGAAGNIGSAVDAWAASDLAVGHPSSPGRAWSAGLPLFWRYAGLWLVLAALAIPIALRVLIAAPPFVLLLAAGLSSSGVVAFAQRALVVEDVGPMAALRSSWQLARHHIRESLLSWQVNVGVALASGIAIVALVTAALGVLVALEALLFAAAGPSTPTLVYPALAGIVSVGGVLTLAGAVNTFCWTFWTLVYLHLRGATAT